MTGTFQSRIRVLLVDDSAIVRHGLSSLVTADPELELVGTAMDPYVARDKILALNPDVLLLDLGLPRMDGITFLKTLMRHRPMPVIVVSGLVQPGSELAIAALEAGAVDVVAKTGGVLSAEGLGPELIAKIKQAVRFARKWGMPPGAGAAPAPAGPAPVRRAAPALPRAPRRVAGASEHDPRQLILFGASTGGTEALKEILTRLPATLPGICIVQHIPPKFSLSFAQRLNSICEMEVREAVDGDVVEPGLALIAPGNFHMTLTWHGDHYRVQLDQGAELHHQRPAVDRLFASAVASAGPHVVAALLTGMGRDGAAGLKQLRDAGARTLAQDEASCVVFGMPQAAMLLGAAEQMVALDALPEAILRRVRAAHVAVGA